MNFKIEQTYPCPSQGISTYNTLVYAQNINSLILYGEQSSTTEVPPEQAKKKIAFKADKLAATQSNDKISVFSITDRRWIVIEAKGKIPSQRSDFKCLYMEPCMILYGGKVKGKQVNEAYALNCETWTWKKLFSLDGPPAGEETCFFKISQTTAGLVVASTFWLLQLGDVKWELTANELPGSVWEKVNIVLPLSIQSGWALSEENIVLLGRNSGIRINILLREKESQFEINMGSIFENKLKGMFSESVQFEEEYKFYYAHVITSEFVYTLSYSDHHENLQLMSEENINLLKKVKCCAYKNRHQDSPGFIYYLDHKSELVSIETELEISEEPNTVRLAFSPQRQNHSNSCILEEEENEDSSMLIPSNSRVELGGIDGVSGRSGYENKRGSKGLQNDETEGLARSPNLSPKIEIFVEGRETSDHSFEKEEFCSQLEIEEMADDNKNSINLVENDNESPLQTQKHKFKTEEQSYAHQKLERIVNQNKEMKDGEKETNKILKKQLGKVLCYESIRRNILESKIKELKNEIINFRHFVHELEKDYFPDDHFRQRHIQNVKNIRNKIEANQSKESLFRKEMKGNKSSMEVTRKVEVALSYFGN